MPFPSSSLAESLWGYSLPGICFLFVGHSYHPVCPRTFQVHQTYLFSWLAPCNAPHICRLLHYLVVCTKLNTMLGKWTAYRFCELFGIVFLLSEIPDKVNLECIQKSSKSDSFPLVSWKSQAKRNSQTWWNFTLDIIQDFFLKYINIHLLLFFGFSTKD